VVVKPEPKKRMSRGKKALWAALVLFVVSAILGFSKPNPAPSFYHHIVSTAIWIGPWIPFLSGIVVVPLCLAVPGFFASFEKRLNKHWKYRLALLGPCIILGVLGLVVAEQQRRKAD